MEQTNANLFDLQIDPQSQSYLAETAKWAKFIAIVSFVMVGFIIIGLFSAAALMATDTFVDSGMGNYGSGFFVGVGIVMVLLVVVPNIFLFRFANKMQLALRHNHQPSLITAFSNIKSCYKFIGIFYLVIISIWVLSFIVGLFAGMRG